MPSAFAQHVMRRHLGFALVLALLAPLFLIWTWNDQLGEVGSDATDYLLMAEAYAGGMHADPVIAEAAAVSRFPPLYPLTLAWSGAASDLIRAHCVSTLFLLVALSLLYRWLCKEGMETDQAALVTLAFAVLPVTWLIGLLIQSEYLYLLFSVAAVALLSSQQRHPVDVKLFAAALLIAAAVLTRTVGVALLPPLLVVALRGKRRVGAVALAIATAPLLLWHGLHRSQYSYGTALQLYYGGRLWSGVIAQVRDQLGAMYRVWMETLATGSTLGSLVAGLWAVLVLFVLAKRALAWRVDAVYLLAYLAILLVWPYPEVLQRLLWPIVPILLVLPLLELRRASLRIGTRSVAPLFSSILGVFLLCKAIPEISYASARYREAAFSEMPDVRGFEAWYGHDVAHDADRLNAQLALISGLQRIAGQVPATSCVIATRNDLVQYYARRRSVFPPLASVPDPYFEQALRATGCGYVFMFSAGDSHFPVPMHPWQRVRSYVRVLEALKFDAPPPGHSNFATILAQLEPGSRSATLLNPSDAPDRH